MRKSGKYLLVMVSVILTFSLSGAYATDTVKIGALYPRTGPMARTGLECVKGVEIAKEVQNERGGILGKKIEYIPGDAVDAKTAMTEAERLITAKGMKVIMGTMSSSCSYAASEVAEKNGVIYWETHAVAENITARGFKYIFRMVPTSADYGAFHAKFAKYVGAKRIAIIGEDSLFGTAVSGSAAREAVALGLQVVYTQLYSRKAVDLSPLIMKIKAVSPDHVVAVSYGPDAILLTKQMRDLGCNVPSLVGTGAGHNLPDFYKALGKDANYFGAVYGWNSDFEAPGVEEFVKRYTEKYGHKPYGHDAGQGYNGAMVLFKVIEKAGSLDPKTIREVAREIDIPANETITGFGANFDRTGQNTKAKLAIGQWQDGVMYTVWPKTVATRDFIRPMPTWKERGE